MRGRRTRQRRGRRRQPAGRRMPPSGLPPCRDRSRRRSARGTPSARCRRSRRLRRARRRLTPTDLMSPLARTMVPPSIGAPETGTIRALRMAMGATGWAVTGEAPSRAHTPRRTPPCANAQRFTNTASSDKCKSHHARVRGEAAMLPRASQPDKRVACQRACSTTGYRLVVGSGQPARCRDHDECRRRIRQPDDRCVTRRAIGWQGRLVRTRASVPRSATAQAGASVRAAGLPWAPGAGRPPARWRSPAHACAISAASPWPRGTRPAARAGRRASRQFDRAR